MVLLTRFNGVMRVTAQKPRRKHNQLGINFAPSKHPAALRVSCEEGTMKQSILVFLFLICAATLFGQDKSVITVKDSTVQTMA